MEWVGSAACTVLQFYVGVARLSLILPITAWKVWRSKRGDVWQRKREERKNGGGNVRKNEVRVEHKNYKDDECEKWKTASEAKDEVTKSNTHKKPRESEGKHAKSVQGLVEKWNQIESGTPGLTQNYSHNKNNNNQKFDIKRAKFDSNNTMGTQNTEFYKQFYLMQDKYDKLEGKIKDLLDKHGKVVDTLEVIADSASELEKGIQENYSSLKELYTRIETISHFEDQGFCQDKNRKRNFWRSNQTLTSIGSYSLSQQDLRESKVSLSKDVSQSMDCLPLTSPALVSTLSRNQCSLSLSTSTLDVGAFSSLPPSSATHNHPWAILEPSSHVFQKEQSSILEPSSHVFQKEQCSGQEPNSHMFQKEQPLGQEPNSHIFNKNQSSNYYKPAQSKNFYKEKDMLVTSESINFKEIHLEDREGIKERQVHKFGSSRARRRDGLSKSQSEIQTGDKVSWMKNVFYRLSSPNLMSLVVKVRTSLEEDALDQATGTFKFNKQ